MKLASKRRTPDIEWERIEYSLKNGATVEIIREKLIEDEDALDIDSLDLADEEEIYN